MSPWQKEKALSTERVVSYIDGFNLYFGLKARRLRSSYWLNLSALCNRLMRSGQELVQVKYFTARISGPPAKVQRQNTFLEAVGTLPDVTTFYGNYQADTVTCRNCKCIWTSYAEKRTDVNIAVELLTARFQMLRLRSA